MIIRHTFYFKVNIFLHLGKKTSYSRVRNRRSWTLKLFLQKIPPWTALLEAFLLNKCPGRLLISNKIFHPGRLFKVGRLFGTLHIVVVTH